MYFVERRIFKSLTCNLTFRLKLTDIMLFILEVTDGEFFATLDTA